MPAPTVLHRLPILALLLTVPLALAPTTSAQEDVTAAYQRLHAAEDADGLAELWAANPERILVTIDADLEGSLAAWEADPDAPDAEAIAGLQARALWGARIASEVTGRPIFRDYASAFIGWNQEQKRDFRAGQAAYGAARQAFGRQDVATAAAKGRECRGLALPLGDWWGAAMGYSIEGQALVAGGETADGLAALGQARLIYQQLGLTGSEYGCLRGLVEGCVAAEHWTRAREAATEALAMARALGDEDGAGAFETRLEEIDAALER